jgi:hypothetical protein
MALQRKNIFAHRGVWGVKEDQNAESAITNALQSGFSVEIDLRDLLGSIVISHDPPKTQSNLAIAQLRRAIYQIGSGIQDQVLALNVKSDGLIALFDQNPILPINHFFFDMSLPENYRYREVLGLSPAIRVSEYESIPNGCEIDDEWIWLDGFKSDWWLENPRHEAEIMNLTTRKTKYYIKTS